MTPWLLHQSLAPDEEAHIRQLPALELPLGDAPDLTGITSIAACRRRLAALYPEEPPEALARRLERLWRLYGGVQKEDILAVPLRNHKALALAEVSGPYRYETGGDGRPRHLIPVTWHDKTLRITGSLKDAIDRSGQAMAEIEHLDARLAIRDRLPHAHNRFARWKWLMAMFTVLGALGIVQQFAWRH